MLHYIVFLIFIVLLLRKYENTAILLSALACYLSVFRDPLNSMENLFQSLSLVVSVIGLIRYKKQVIYTPFFYCIIPILITYTIVMMQYNSKEYEIMSYSTNQKMLVSLYITIPIAINVLMIAMNDMFYIMNFIYEAILVYALYLQISLNELK